MVQNKKEGLRIVRTAVPELVATLYLPLAEYFSVRDAPEDISENPYEAAREWIEAYGMDGYKKQKSITDAYGTVSITDETCFIELDPFRPQPARFIVGTLFSSGEPIAYMAFIGVEHGSEVCGIVRHRLSDGIWIDGSLQRFIGKEEDVPIVLNETIGDQFSHFPETTDAIFTYCILDPHDPPPSGGGNEEALLAA